MKSSTQNQDGRGLRAVFFSKPACGFLRLVIAGLLLGLFAPAVYAWERTDVLDAIHQVENPHNTMRIGRRGELGPFQFRPAVWFSYTEKPFSLAAERAEAQIVAEAHYEWIKRGLVRNKLEVTPYHIGLAWNAGLHATINGRASGTSKYYAERVANLVESKVASVSPVSPVVPAQPEPAKVTESM